MRWFFFLLLISNLGFIGWQFYQQRGDDGMIDVYRGITMVSNGLTLISELPEGQRPALREMEAQGALGAMPQAQNAKQTILEVPSSPAGRQRAVTAGEIDTLCYRIANIEEMKQLASLVGWLQDNHAAEIEQAPYQASQVRYWVMLPAYPNRDKANEAAKILASRRVKDFFIVRSGEHENAVSLGVFSTRERAERRYAQIVGLKARLRRPRIDKVEHPLKRYQVSFRLAAGEARKRLDNYLERMKLPQAKTVECK